jgi:Domain of unknown function (DUF4192)
MTTPELSFASPAELLAALPYLLGFVPKDDLVVVMLGPSSPIPSHLPVRAAIRCPITITRRQAQHLPRTCGLPADEFRAAVLIAVCDADRDQHALTVLNAVRAALQKRDIPVLRMLTTRSITEAGVWLDPDTGARGHTVAFTDSPATAVAVLHGRVIAASTDDIEREFSTAEPALEMNLEAQDLPALIADTAYDLHRVITGYRDPGSELASRAAVLVTAHVGLRDGLLRLALGHEHAAAWVWTRIAAHHRGRTRAELLAMAALAYYAGDDTLRAGRALSHAGAAARNAHAPLPTLAVMLQTALQNGLPAVRIRGVIPSREKAPIPGTEL